MTEKTRNQVESGLDNCSDPDCQGTLADDNNDGVWDGCGPENTKEFCIDGLDNDNDGLTDCDDPECAAYNAENGCELDIIVELRIGEFNCTDGAICYDLVVKNNGDDDFNIENLNFPLLIEYPDCGCFSLQSQDWLLDPSIYNLNSNNNPNLLAASATLISGQDPTQVGAGSELKIFSICFTSNIDFSSIGEDDCFSFETNVKGTHAVNGGGSTDITTPWILPNEFNDQPCLSELCTAEGPENSPTACSDGIDNDHDGLTDCQDGDCSTIDPLIVRIALESEDECGEGQGQIKVTLPEGTNMTDYSICIGDNCVDPATGIISELSAGEHEIVITNSNGCDIIFQLVEDDCENGLDDDGDGYIDCDDLDCFINSNKSSDDRKLKSSECDVNLGYSECIENNEDYLRDIGVNSVDEANLICEAINSWTPDEVPPSEIEEIENCIDIISSQVPITFSGTLVAQSPYRHPNSMEPGGDLATLDVTISEAEQLLAFNNEGLLKLSDEELFVYFNELLDFFSNNDYGPITEIFLNQFRTGNNSTFESDQLNQLLLETNEFKNKVKLFGELFSCALEEEECFDDGSCSFVQPSVVMQLDDVFKELLAHFSWEKNEGYLRMGPTVLVNDTEQINYYIQSFNYDISNGSWDACFFVESLDHFGLDHEDLRDFQNIDLGFLDIGRGFASWWILQHMRGYKPFTTVMKFEICITGNYDECDCE